MMHFRFIFILLLIFSTGCTSIKKSSETEVNSNVPPPSVPETTDYHSQITWLLGYFDQSQFKRPPHAEWFIKGFDDYTPAADILNELLKIDHDGLTIKIVLGTWCPDSRREVPRFMKILDLWKFPASAVTFIGVDDAKLSPVGEYESLHIERVPTFIFYRNNSEAGRIIEVPKASLEQDMLSILTGIE
jgi:hypothetical protein